MSRPSLHRQAVIIHQELSIVLSPSCPALKCRAVHRQAVHCRAVQRFIAEPSIASRCQSRAVLRDIAKPSIATLPSRPALYRQAVAVHRQAIHCQAVHCTQMSITSCPLPSRPLRRAVHRKLSIATSSSRPSLHRHAVFCELSIVSRPSLHRQAVIVHHKLSIALLPSRPALNGQAVHCQAVCCRAVQRFIAEPSITSCHPSLAVRHDITEPSIATLPSHPALYRPMPSRQLHPAVNRKLSITKPSISLSSPSRAVHRYIV